MYVVTLVGIIFGSCVGLMIVFFAVLRIYIWKKEKRYDRNDLSQNEKRLQHLMLIGRYIHNRSILVGINLAGSR